MPKVSVVMPVYNRQSMVNEAIDSILKQDFSDFEFIIINDGSTDRTGEILSSYSDPRLRIVELPVNCGIGCARNIGMKHASGDYIAVMDSDDISMENRLSEQVAFMESNPNVHILGTDAVKIINSQEIKMKHPQNDAVIKARLLAMDGSSMIHPTSMMRAAFLNQHRIQYHTFFADEDHVLWIDAMAAGATFHLLNKHLLIYRRHGSNITTETKRTLQVLQADKTKYRSRLLSLLLPDLTHTETLAIAKIMEEGRQLTIVEASQGISAAIKAQKFERSIYGESRQLINQFIGRHVTQIMTAMESSANKSP